jgi:hypothetical protein
VAFGLRVSKDESGWFSRHLVHGCLATCPEADSSADGSVFKRTEDQITLLDQSLDKHIVVEGDRCSDRTSSKAISFAAARFSQSRVFAKELWMNVVKLLRAHGGCLGVRRL